MPTVYLDIDGGVTLVKYRYVERESVMPRQSAFEKLCWKSSPTLIEAPAAGRAEREHLRLIAPPGLSVTDMWLARIGNGHQTQPSAGRRPTFQYRVALERGVLYSTGLERGTYIAIASLMPNATEFALPALIATLVSALMLLGGAWYQQASAVLADAQSTIALLLLAPSSVAAYLTRRGEHQLLGRLLRWPRVLVGLTAIGSLLSAAVIVLQRQDLPKGVEPLVNAGTVVSTWGLAGTYAAAVTVLLAVAAYRGRFEKRQVPETPLASEVEVHELQRK